MPKPFIMDQEECDLRMRLLDDLRAGHETMGQIQDELRAYRPLEPGALLELRRKVEELQRALTSADGVGNDTLQCLAEVAAAREGGHIEDAGLRLECDKLRAKVAAFEAREPALVQLLNTWPLFTSQEMYGELLRDGMELEDFQAWDEAFERVRDFSLAETGTPKEGT